MNIAHGFFLVWTQPIYQTKVPRQAFYVTPFFFFLVQPIGMILLLLKNEEYISYVNILLQGVISLI